MNSKHLQTLALAAASVLGVVNLIIAVLFHQPAPHADMVDVEAFFDHWSLARDGLEPLLTYPDNEHRSFLPLLLQAMDHDVFGSRGIFLAIVHAMCFALVAAIIATHARLALNWAGYGVLAAAAAIVVMLWSEHWYNISRLKQTHICLALLSFTTAYWLLARADARSNTLSPQAKWTYVAGACALLVNAGWSFAAGLAAFPGVILLVFVRRFTWAQRVTVILAGVFTAATRTWASILAGSPSASGDLAPPVLAQLHYAANFVGGFARRALGGDEIVAPLLGLIGIIVAGPVIWRALQQRGASANAADQGALSDRRQSASFFTLLMIWSIICTVGITPNRAQLGADQAFSGRYLIFSAIFWVSILPLLALAQFSFPRWARRAIVSLIVVFAGLIVLTQPRGWLKLAEHQRRVAVGAVAAHFDIAPGHPYQLHVQDILRPVVATARDEERSYYARPWGQWLLGKNLDQLTSPAPQICDRVDGAVALLPAPDGGLRIAAQFSGPNGAGPNGKWIVLMQGEDVVGLARRGESFPDAPQLIHSAHASYAGFARLTGDTPVSAIVVLRGGHACQVAIKDDAR